MRQREKRGSECLGLQDKEMESPYVCEGCEIKAKWVNDKENTQPVLGKYSHVTPRLKCDSMVFNKEVE